MPSLLSTIKSGLIKSPFFSTLPANILTIPLEMLADYKFSCPCDSGMNTTLTGLVFSAPAFYILALILLYCRYVKSEKNKKEKREKEENKCKTFCNNSINVFMYLFPPILWIIMLLLDGDYMACSNTDWKGEYVLDDKLKRKWCKPTELIPGGDETELQILTLSFIYKSQCWGYAVLLTYSFFMVIILLCWFRLNCKEKPKPQPDEEEEEEEENRL